MAKDDIGGVWRTISGRRVFIKDGQDLATAMIESGKFKNLRSSYKKAKEEEKTNKEKEEYELYKKAKENPDKIDPMTENSTDWEALDKKYKSQYLKEKVESDKTYKAISDYENGAKTYEEVLKVFDGDEKALSKRFEEMGYKSPVEYEKEKIFKEVAMSTAKAFGAKEVNVKGEKIDLSEKEDKIPISEGAPSFEKLGLQVEDKKAFSDYLREKYGTDDFRVINFENKENAQKIYDEFKNKTFTQTSTNPFYSDKEYTQEDLKRMEENGIRPTKNSYSGNGWEGVNSNKNLTTSEQAKAITDEMKKQFPDVKIARKSDVYSGGSSITFSVMSSDKDLYISDKDIDKLGSEQLFNTEITRGWGFDRWADDNVPNYKTEHTYNVEDVKRYAKEKLANLKKGDNQSVTGNEWYLSDYGKKVMTELNKQANSYTYDDSDAMTDYFNHGTYMWVNIGKWDKPYQVNEKSDTSKTTNQIMNDAIRRKSYENYMKKHPSSNMTFEEFKNQ